MVEYDLSCLICISVLFLLYSNVDVKKLKNVLPNNAKKNIENRKSCANFRP